jgi:cholesterol oxidase
VLFVTGANNRVFTDSNIVCFERLRGQVPGNPHELLILKGYGHQDPFMGKDVARDVFPQFLPFLRKHSKLGKGAGGAAAA